MLGQSERELFFGGAMEAPPRCDRALGCGQFVEGLWQADVIELFVREPSSAGYHEINLAPTGAWWHCRFEEYRLRTGPVPGEVRALSCIDEEGWSAAVALPRAALPGVDLAAVRWNVCAIAGDPRRFYTHEPAGPGSPDFHRVIAAL